MPELSKPFRDLLNRCATCGGEMPCPLHDEQLREAILAPREDERFPWDKYERKAVYNLNLVGVSVRGVTPGPRGSVIVTNRIGRAWEFNCALPHLGPREIIGDYAIAGMLYLPDGRRLDYGPHGLNLIDGTEQMLLANGPPDIDAVALSPDGTVLCASANGDIWSISLPLPPQEGKRKTLWRGWAGIRALVPLPDGSLLVSQSGSMRGIPMGGTFLASPMPPPGYTFNAAFAQRMDDEPRLDFTSAAPFSEGTFLLVGSDGVIRRLDPTYPEGDPHRLTDLVDVGRDVGQQPISVAPLPDDSFMVSVESSQQLIHYAIPADVLAAYQKRKERKLDAPEIPPMPE